MPVSARSTALGGLLGRLLGSFQGPLGDLDPRPVGLGLGELRCGQFPVRLGRVAGPRHLLGTPQRHGLLLFAELVNRVYSCCARTRSAVGGFDAGLGLLDPFFDFVLGELQSLLCSGLVRLRGREAAAGDFDLDGDLQPEPREGGLLPPQFRLGRLHLAAGQLDLVSVGNRVDLRQDLSLLDPVVLLDQEADEVPRNRLRGDVDDVGLDKGIFRDRMVPAVGPPPASEHKQQRREHQPANPHETNVGAFARHCGRGKGSRLLRRRGGRGTSGRSGHVCASKLRLRTRVNGSAWNLRREPRLTRLGRRRLDLSGTSLHPNVLVSNTCTKHVARSLAWTARSESAAGVFLGLPLK